MSLRSAGNTRHCRAFSLVRGKFVYHFLCQVKSEHAQLYEGKVGLKQENNML